MTNEANKIVKKQGIIYGVLLGIIVTALSILSFYYITQMVSSAVWIIIGYSVLFPLVLPVAAATYFIIKLRAKIGGYWSFKDAVRSIFIVFLTAYITQLVLKDGVFIKLIEPNIVEKTEAAMIRDARADFIKRHISQKDIDAKIKEIHENLDPQKNVTVGQQIQGLGFSIIFLFVLSLIFAGFLKRDEVYNPSNNTMA